MKSKNIRYQCSILVVIILIFLSSCNKKVVPNPIKKEEIVEETEEIKLPKDLVKYSTRFSQNAKKNNKLGIAIFKSKDSNQKELFLVKIDPETKTYNKELKKDQTNTKNEQKSFNYFFFKKNNRLFIDGKLFETQGLLSKDGANSVVYLIKSPEDNEKLVVKIFITGRLMASQREYLKPIKEANVEHILHNIVVKRASEKSAVNTDIYYYKKEPFLIKPFISQENRLDKLILSDRFNETHIKSLLKLINDLSNKKEMIDDLNIHNLCYDEGVFKILDATYIKYTKSIKRTFKYNMDSLLLTLIKHKVGTTTANIGKPSLEDKDEKTGIKPKVSQLMERMIDKLKTDLEVNYNEIL